MAKGHPHHKMYEKHSKGGHVHHMGEGHWEKKMEELPVSDLKYGTEFGAPEELHKQVAGLVGYVKKHKMNY